MNEIGFVDISILVIKSEPALIAITIALLIAMKKCENIIVCIFLFLALVLQYYATTKNIIHNLEINTTISCLEQKIEAINQNSNIANLEIDKCKKAQVLKKIYNSF